MKCKDCGILGGPFGIGKLREKICPKCFATRLNVIKARTENKMSQIDFENYQRHGLRTNRLIKMGYKELISQPQDSQHEQ